MKNYLISLLTILFGLFSSQYCLADHYPGKRSPALSAGINIERLHLNPAIADRELIDEKATAFNLGLDFGNRSRRKPHISFGAGLSFINFHDYGQFTQETVNGNGYIIDSSSDAEAIHLYFEGGPSVPLSRYTQVSFKAGYTLPVSSERSIDNCSACYSEEINIDGGTYGQLGLQHKIGNISLKSSYKFYLDNNNGIDNSFSLGLYAGY